MRYEELMKDKKVLLIGSGEDLNGRALNDRISAQDCEWDYIARINHHFGDIADVGRRMDICFVARREYANWYFHTAVKHGPGLIVAFRDGCACDCHYRESVAKKLDMGERVSSGLAAVHWLLEHGAKVDVIGFGKKDSTEKRYPDGKVDNVGQYDWTAERLWIESQSGVTML